MLELRAGNGGLVGRRAQPERIDREVGTLEELGSRTALECRQHVAIFEWVGNYCNGPAATDSNPIDIESQ